MDLPPIQPVEFNRASKGFNRQCNLNGFTPNLTGHLKALTGNVISMDLHPIRPVEFDWHLKALTGNVISMDLHPI